MNAISCMGGLCHLRDKCPKHLTDDRRFPVERLCEPGEESEMVRSRVIHRAAGSWERVRFGLAAAQPFDMVTP